LRVLSTAALIIVLAAPFARAAALASPSSTEIDATGKALSATAPAQEKVPAPLAWNFPASPGSPHIARPWRGPKPKQEGLQLRAEPHAWPIRIAQFLGWALVP
jgi:hypothetical protein